MADINKVWISGLVVTPPVFSRLREKTPRTSFSIQINEQFRDGGGNLQIKPNIIKIESLGKHADLTVQKVKPGQRYVVDGYLRQDVIDQRDEVKVRTFAIYPDESAESVHHRKGLEEALKILVGSRDLESAVEKVRELLKPTI